MAEKAIRDILMGATGVRSIVGTRIYNGFAPQEAVAPFIVYRREGTQRIRAFDGPDGLVNGDFEVNCVSASASQVHTLADEVRLALDNYSGENKGITIRRIMLEDEDESVELEVSGGDKRLRRRAMDFSVWYCETAAT